MTLRQIPRTGLILAAALGLLIAVYLVASAAFRSAETDRAASQASLYHRTLQGALDQYRHLPFILAADPVVQAAAQGGATDAVNDRLAAFAARTDLDAVYLMDLTGLTIAASNHASPVTFLGKNYGFRPYFLDAAAGGSGEFFAIGATTQQPGYFLAQPVLSASNDITGVIAIKVDLSRLTQTWADAGEQVFVSNADGVIVLASEPGLFYQTLTPLDDATRARLDAARQFAGQALTPLDWQSDGTATTLAGRSFIEVRQPLSTLGWTLHYLTPEATVTRAAWTSVGAATVLLLILGALALYFRAEQMRAALKLSQADRRKLRTTNAALEREVTERRAAEARLSVTQDELRRASKLAALGQLSASVTHELGQPISAMKNHIAAAEISGRGSDTRLMGDLGGLVDRMEHITNDLRFFARPAPDQMERVDLRDVWQGAWDLVAPDMNQSAVIVTADLPDTPVTVAGNKLRLEQVLINLLRNARMAVADQPTRQITATIEPAGTIRIADTGPGLGGQSFSDLQEPFHTTRPSGQGMGLGLAISAAIARDHGGTLTGRDGDTGAVFELTLPLADGQKEAAE